jgi:hypothetical protein
VFKCSDDVKGNFDYFAKLNKLFDDEFYQHLFCYFKNEVELVNFDPRLIPDTDIKLEMMDVCKESCLLFFEEKIDKFIKGYEMKKAYSDYKKYCQGEGYNAFSNKTFSLRLGDVVNKMSTTKNKNHFRYYLIKDRVKNKYAKDIVVDFDDISTYDYCNIRAQSLIVQVVC